MGTYVGMPFLLEHITVPGVSGHKCCGMPSSTALQLSRNTFYFNTSMVLDVYIEYSVMPYYICFLDVWLRILFECNCEY